MSKFPDRLKELREKRKLLSKDLPKIMMDYLLNTLPYEARRKVSLYYKEKYKYFLTTKPKQLELKLK